MTGDVFLGKLLAIGLCLLLVAVIMGARFSQAIEQGEVAIGMTSNLVVKAWGEPDHISASEVRKPGYYFLSVKQETWTYNNPARTVVFEDGLVSRVEQIER